eukprot:m.293261 g.293261  ORF g.293261 m.293261 type:complete len:505 (-) comp19847_c0_seq1:73-1587(-)
MTSTWTCLALILVAVQATTLLQDSFDDINSWTISAATKDGASSDIAKYDGKWTIDNGTLVMDTAARHYGLAKKLTTPFKFEDKPFVVQYEVKFSGGMTCGGSYLKLLEQPMKGDLNLQELTDKTPFTIMFGPDKCGAEAHLRFIYRYQNPKTKDFNEVHARRVMDADEKIYQSPRTHLVTLVVRPDSTFVMRIDNQQVSQGDLRSNEDFDPPLQPAKTIDDETDSKPADWIDDEYMEDPTDSKPDSWDESEPMYIEDVTAEKPEEWDESEPELIEDKSAKKPEDWDDEDDGEWEVPMLRNPKCETGCGPWQRPQVKNPNYQGKWHPRRIKNPAYKGVWTPRQLPNPEYFEDKQPVRSLRPIAAVAFELWTVSRGVKFDNLLITDDEALAQQWATERWQPKYDSEGGEGATEVMQQLQDAYNYLTNAADENPYLYIVYTLVLSVLVAIPIFTCCPADEPKSEDSADNDGEDEEEEDATADNADNADNGDDDGTGPVRRRRVAQDD